MQTIAIKTKEDLIQEMNIAYQEVESYVKQLHDDSFDYNPSGKWSVSNHLEHLILSSKGIPSGLKMSKLKLLVFGKSKNGSRSYDELYSAYKGVLSTGIKAPPKFSPDPDKTYSREELLASWNMIKGKFEERIALWSEKDLDSYRMPHPALGKLTVREMLLFTIFHTYHHWRIMKETVGES